MRRLLWGLCALLVWLGPAWAQPSEADREQEVKSAFMAARQAATAGPANIRLIDEGVLHLPAQRRWIPKAEAARILRAWGNHPGDNLLGLVMGRTGSSNWVATVTFTRDGYVKDNDAKDLDPDKLLAQMRQSAEASNSDRIARGFKAITIDEWLQRPRYDSAAKRLVWALPLRDVGADPNSATINYNTRALGRDGYFSLNLLTDREHFEAQKPEADMLLTTLDYAPGKRYQDFNVSTDRVAEYGLAALIGVVALKKLGLIAIATAFVLKFAKLGILAVIGLGAAVRRLIGRAKNRASS